MVTITKTICLLSVVLFVFGCEEKTATDDEKKMTIDDASVYGLSEFIMNNPKLREQAKQNMMRAVELWENEQLDTEPLLIEASLTSAEGIEGKFLTVVFYDEDKDVLGFLVEEVQRVEDKLIFQREYPVYLYTSFSTPTLDDNIGPVSTSPNHEVDIDTGWIQFLEESRPIQDAYAYSTPIPTIYIPAPSEDTVIYISLYDRQGNQSNKVDLIDVTTTGDLGEIDQ